MKQLTSRERILRTLRRQEVDRVPISPRYFDYLVGVHGCDCVHHCLWWRDTCFDHDLMPIYQPRYHNYLLDHQGPYNDLPEVSIDVQIADPGGGVIDVHRRFTTPAGVLEDRRSVVKPGSAVVFAHIIEAPVKDRRDLDKIRFLLPSPEQSYIGDVPLLQNTIGDRGVLLFSATQGVDQFLMDALGVERALITYSDDRRLLVDLVQIFNEYHRAVLRRALELGIEIVFEPWYNCSTGTGWSPSQFRELFLPFIAQNIELIHSYGAYVDYYDDGRMSGVLEDVARAGADIIETLAPPPLGDVDLADAKRRVGDRVCLKGHVDQVNLICFGKPADVREGVRTAMAAAKEGGGFIIGTADSIRPESPQENIRAYFDAAYEFGRYNTGS